MNITLGTATKKHVSISFDEKKALRATDKEMIFGVKTFSHISQRDVLRLFRKIIRSARSYEHAQLTLDWRTLDAFTALKGIESGRRAELLSIEMHLAQYTFVQYKTKPKGGWRDVREVILTHVPTRDRTAIRKGLMRGRIIAEEMNAARTLANTPGSDMPPKQLAATIRKAARGVKGLKVTVLGRTEMKKHGMGAILGVGQGSSHEPQLIVIEYRGGTKTQKPIALVGKGITYDTGGLSLKPGEHMLGMQMDMTGGALVLHSIIAAAKLGIKKNIVAVVGAAENAIGKDSYKPGDVLKSFSGKTIEVKNTDAEGRLVLADAITYVQKKYAPQLIVDVATLTGASLVAVGQVASVVMSRDEEFAWYLRHLGEREGEYMWPLPLWDDYRSELVESNVADIANIGKTRWAGTIEAGMFLAEFVDKKQPWAHIDIAPRMEAVPRDCLAEGSTGEPMRTLLALTQEYTKGRKTAV